MMARLATFYPGLPLWHVPIGMLRQLDAHRIRVEAEMRLADHKMLASAFGRLTKQVADTYLRELTRAATGLSDKRPASVSKLAAAGIQVVMED